LSSIICPLTSVSHTSESALAETDSHFPPGRRPYGPYGPEAEFFNPPFALLSG